MTTPDITFHYPPELFNLLVEAVPRLFRGKKDLLLFFQGAGVQDVHLADLRLQVAKNRESITKFEIVRTVITRLNQVGEGALRERREVLRRVVQFEDFSSCWDNERLEAQGLVHQIQHVVNVKDAFARMNEERERERAAHREVQAARAAKLARRAAVLDEIRKDLAALFGESNPWQRGKHLEGVLNRLFAHCGILVREAFALRGDPGQGIVEQIDGLIDLDSDLYLVEMKWHGSPLGVPEVSQHLVRIFTRGAARALIISDSGFSTAAIAQCREALSQKVVILCELQEIVRIVEGDANLVVALRAKVQAAIADKQPFIRISQ